MNHIELPSAKPPWSRHGKRIESMIRKALYEFDMIKDANKIAIALSGGKDSLSLLFFLKTILGRGTPNCDLIAIHIDGKQSCGSGINKNFLKNICNNLDVPFFAETSTYDPEKLECYGCSRDRRRLIFSAARREGANVVAFGHHRDDSAQTLLMNLFHKGEFAGLLPNLALADYGVRIIRPLIYVSENEVKKFAKEHGFLRTTCQCPVFSIRKRTDMLLSDLSVVFPHVRKNVASAGLIYGSRKGERGYYQKETSKETT
ncbi:Uncharacterized protein CLAVI_000977 [Candidatus Clavichlamydia salmonicola]|uniref:tRNA 2-thiocytidine biosynthesis TtcA family protein n=1 Tax=Candidatus Clavichlamydia salmonicola TaxID=469812 RepID=UPI001890D464|nr:tRNA 2-thiocytidine biosynthesis TtcA family protein [Candidatus Clavichlamydia salmonicola]MBF5051334.1 Uncharacterized protein [Candidatus Clavichlamydia salmonicola]